MQAEIDAAELEEKDAREDYVGAHVCYTQGG
jgi:hypothetical protein